MEEAPSDTVRLSSRLTLAYRYTGAALSLVLVLFGIGVLPSSRIQAAFLFVMAAAGVLWSRARSFQLCNVWASPKGLIVARGSLRVVLPYASILGARQQHAFGLTEVQLRERSALGRVVLFLAYPARFYRAEHTAALLIQQRVASAAASGA